MGTVLCLCPGAGATQGRRGRRIQIGGAHYEVDADLAGEEVLLWWGLSTLTCSSNGTTVALAPTIRPVPDSIAPLSPADQVAHEKRAETVAALAEKITIPREAVSGALQPASSAEIIPLPRVAFADPDPWGEIAYANVLSARRAIADQLRRPLGELGDEDLAFITELVGRTLNKIEIETAIRARFIRPAGR